MMQPNKIPLKSGEIVYLNSKGCNSQKAKFEKIENNNVMFSLNNGYTNLMLSVQEYSKSWTFKRIFLP